MRARATLETIAVLVALVAATPMPVHAAPGDLDLTFGESGKTLHGFGFGNDVCRAMAVQADGKLVMAGNYEASSFRGDLLVIRYDTNDALDPSFGVGGVVRTPIPPLGATGNAMLIQPDGKIIVGGTFPVVGGGDFLLVRYNVDGSLDPTFGGDGIVTTDFGGQSDECAALAIQADGKIVASGFAIIGTAYNFGVARYNPDGSLDPSFDGDGKATTGGESGGRGVAVQLDGKIVVVGTVGGTNITVIRFNANGSLDTSFDGDGKVFTAIPTASFSRANAIGLQPTVPGGPEKIVVAGMANFASGQDYAVVRYNANGALDTSFDGDGIVTTAVGASNDQAYALLIRASTITVAGVSVTSFADDFSVARYNLNGSLDVSFNGTGKRITPLFQGASQDQGYAIALQGGKTVVAGSGLLISSDFALVRYNSNGTLDVSLDGDGIKLQDIVDRRAELSDMAIQADGKIVAVGNTEWGTTMGVAVARYDVNGTLDPSFGSNGKVVYSMSGGGNAVAIQPDGKIVVAGSHQIVSGYGFSLLRLDVDGSLDPTFGDFGDNVNTPIGPGDAWPASIALQADGKIIVAGVAENATDEDFAVVRYLPDGTLDTSFDADGIVTTAIATGNDQAREVKIQTDGKIVVAGTSVVGSSEDFALVRYHANGSLDNSFGSFGRVATDFGSGRPDFGFGMLIQPDGRIVMSGGSLGVSNFDFAVARYNANGTLDSSFDGDGRVTTPIGISEDIATSVALQADGKLMVAGMGVIGASQDFSLVRYQPNGSLDEGYGFGGKVVLDFVGGTEVGWDVVLDNAGRAVVGGLASDLFGVARFEGDQATVDVPLIGRVAVVSRIRGVAPNPAAAIQTLFVDVIPGQPVRSLSVYAVTGQRVWTEDLSRLPAGTHRVDWNGRMTDGRTASPGIYFARLDGVPLAASQRVVRIR